MAQYIDATDKSDFFFKNIADSNCLEFMTQKIYLT